MPATKTQRPPRSIIPVSLRADVAAALRDLATREDLHQSILIRRAVNRLLLDPLDLPSPTAGGDGTRPHDATFSAARPRAFAVLGMERPRSCGHRAIARWMGEGLGPPDAIPSLS